MTRTERRAELSIRRAELEDRRDREQRRTAARKRREQRRFREQLAALGSTIDGSRILAAIGEHHHHNGAH